jgi:hypothetical protein
MPKDSKHKKLIDKTIIQFSESGFLERTQNFWFSGTCREHDQSQGSSRSVNQFDIRQSSSVFLLLSAGKKSELFYYKNQNLSIYILRHVF